VVKVRAQPDLGGIVKRSLAMVFLACGAAIAKACGLDDATHHTAREVKRSTCWRINQ
jgi:hypothetical protein